MNFYREGETDAVRGGVRSKETTREILLLLLRRNLLSLCFLLIQPLKEMNFKLFSVPFLHLSMTFVSILSGIRILIISLVFGLTKIRVNFLLLDLSRLLAVRLVGGMWESYRNRS